MSCSLYKLVKTVHNTKSSQQLSCGRLVIIARISEACHHVPLDKLLHNSGKHSDNSSKLMSVCLLGIVLNVKARSRYWEIPQVLLSKYDHFFFFF